MIIAIQPLMFRIVCLKNNLNFLPTIILFKTFSGQNSFINSDCAGCQNHHWILFLRSQYLWIWRPLGFYLLGQHIVNDGKKSVFLTFLNFCYPSAKFFNMPVKKYLGAITLLQLLMQISYNKRYLLKLNSIII